jgi:predicted phage replisome organizer
MAENVQWIRLKVGMFDGNSFKKIKRAKIGGVSYRDKLTAIWFELLDLAGKSNANGYLIDNNEIPYQSFEDIATMLDREEKEIELCMQFFINERMVEIVDDIYCLTNFMEYQNKEGLDKIRQKNRERQTRFRENQKAKLLEIQNSNVTHNVTDNVTSRSESYSYSNSNSYSISNYEKEFEEIWNIYPNKQGKSKALKSYIKARKDKIEFDTIKDGVERYASYCKINGTDKKYISHGDTWFGNRRWTDEYDTQGGNNAGTKQGANGDGSSELPERYGENYW